VSQLTFCITKTLEVFEMGPAISVDGNQLQEVNHQRYLGIIFDKKLNWDCQVNDVCKQVAYYLHLLNINRKSLTFSVLKLLTESLIFSRLTYALPVCPGSTFTNKSKYSFIANESRITLRVFIVF